MRMQVAVVIVALAACVVADKPSGQVISRTVSVKSPDRVSSVISHFSPADHRYEATGSVLIAKNPAEATRPNLQTYRPPAVSAPAKPAELRGSARPATKASGAALTRTVKVKTPVRVPSVISHFVPADHRYEAEGSVTIVKGSAAAARSSSSSGFSGGAQFSSQPAPAREVKVVRKINRPIQTFSSAAGSADKLALTRTVSVKTPERVPSVISHFVPADHRYEATGSVTIVKGSQSSSRGATRASASSQSQLSRPTSDLFIAKRPALKRPASTRPDLKPSVSSFTPKVITRKSSGSSSSADKLALTRTVSVRTPERNPTVISHFVPADHRYEATGSVTIVRGSQSSTRGSSGASSASKTKSVRRPAVPAIVRLLGPASAPAPVRPLQLTKRVSKPIQSSPSSAANLALTRTVSVKSPKRIPKVISHFVPAEHQYEATGSVTIVRGSESSSRKNSGGSLSGAAATSTFKSAASEPAPPRAAPKPSRRVEFVRKVNQPVRSSSSSASASDGNLALTRTVSVKSPQRQSSIISHFLPAEHKYEATGSVTIVKGGRQSSSSQRVSSGSASSGAGRGSSFSAFGQASGSASSQTTGRRTATGQSRGGSFAAVSSSKTSGRKTSFSSSDESSSSEESNSGSRSSGRVSFGSSQSVSAGTFGQASTSAGRFAGGQGSSSTSQKTSSSSGRQDFSSARKQASAIASGSRSSGFGASASAQRSQSSASGQQSQASASGQRSQASVSAQRSQASASAQRQAQASAYAQQQAAAAAAAAARDSSSEESYSYQLAESYRGGSSVSAAELLAELQSFREDAARSGVKINQNRHSGRDDFAGSSTGPYTFSIRVQDDDSTNYQSRDEWVGEDGVTYGWYTVVMPDGYSYNYTYTSHPVKGYQVKVNRKDSGIALKPVQADIFAPATVFSNKGIGRFAEFAVSGVNNDYKEENRMNYDENAAAMFADSLSDAMKTTQQSSSTRAVVSSGPPSHICGHRIVRVRGSRTPGARTVEDLVYGPCTYREEVAAHGSSGSAGRTSGSGSSSQSSIRNSFSGSSFSAGSSSSSGSKSSGSAFRGASQSSGSSFKSASKASGSSSDSSTQSGSTFGSARQSGSASRSSSQSGSAFGSASQSGSASRSASQSGSAFGSASQSSSASRSNFASGSGNQRGSTFGSGSQSGSASRSASKRGSSFGSANQDSSAFGFGSKSSAASGSGSQSRSAFASGSQSGGFGSTKQSGSAFRSGSQSAGSAIGSGSGSAGSSGASSVRFFQSSSSAGSSDGSGASGSSGARFFGSAGRSSFDDSNESGSGRSSAAFKFHSTSNPSSSEEKKSSGFVHFVKESSETGSSKENSDEGFSKFSSSSSSFSSGFSSSARTGGGGSSRGTLTRTVSVKSPARHSSVISHFTPADHIYDATAGVTLGSGSIRQSSTPSQAVFVSTKTDSSAAAARKVAESARNAASRGSKLALTRTVSVKSPDRKSTVISHFTPAEHRYEAIGSVTIQRDSKQSISSASPIKTFTVKASPAPVPVSSGSSPALVPASVPTRGYSPPRSPSSSDLSLTRTVSVKTPERKSSVISFFTPADHKYEATGSVTINRSSA